MKVTILKEKLQKGLSLLSHMPGKNISLPILSNVLLFCEKNFLTITATDLEVAVKLWFLAKVEKEGGVAVSPSVLSGAIRATKEASVVLVEDNHNLVLEEKNLKTSIQGLLVDDFPLVPDVKKDVFFDLPASLFCQAISFVVDFVAISSSRPELSGVYFSFEGDSLKVVATDSFRLAEKKILIKKGHNQKTDIVFILPQKTAKEIVSIFGDTEDLKVFLSENQVLFESLMQETNHPGINLVSRLISGEYPNYKEIIPQNYDTQIYLNKDEFFNHLKLASLFCGKTNEVKLKINQSSGSIEIFAKSEGLGQHSSSLSCKIESALPEGSIKEVSFNCKFLLDGILKIKSSELFLGLTERNKDVGPGVLKPVGDDSYIYVLMPLRS